MNPIAILGTGIAAFLKYGPAALLAVKGVEDAVGSGNGATKKQIAVAAVLSVAHAGESVDAPTVQAIATVIDLVVNSLNLSGALGKPAVAAAIPAPALQPVV